MKLRTLVRIALCSALAAGLAGCGGGGGGSGGGDGGARVALSGTVTYDRVPNAANGRLDYGAIASRPVRGATVEALAAGSAQPLASATTDDSGHYAMELPAGSRITVRVRAQMTRSGQGGTWDVTVRDNTRGGPIYAMESPEFSPDGPSSQRDLHAPSGWTGASYGEQRTSAPFAILDTVYRDIAKVRGTASTTDFPALRLYWSPDNTPTSGRIAQGQIGTTSFTMDSQGSAIYVLGKENVDTDEFDESVISHEWGHYYQSNFSRDDSLGGSHSTQDRLDPRVAFSEGWGNAWSGMALERSTYTDSMGARQSLATFVNLDATVSNPGWFRESSVHTTLWRIYQQYGFDPIHRVFTGPLRQTPALVTIHAFAAAYGSVQPDGAATLASILSSQGISGATNDPWAGAESNNGGVDGVLPIYARASTGSAQTACVRNAAGTYNKLGNTAFLRYSIAQAGRYQVSVNGPGGTDPDLAVFGPSGELASALAVGTGDSLSAVLPAGDIVVAVTDANLPAPAASQSVTVSCLQVTLN